MAFQCESDITAIDAALAKNPSLSASQLDEVKALLAEGEKLHYDGRHVAAVRTLAKAKEILGVK